MALAAVGRERFDLDAATNDFATVPALARLRGPEYGEDAFAKPWPDWSEELAGVRLPDVWLNFPFSKPGPWRDRVEVERARCRSISVLGPNDHSTWWNGCLTRLCDAWAAWPRREHFPVEGQPKGSPPGGVSLWYFGPESTRWLRTMREAGCVAYPGHP